MAYISSNSLPDEFPRYSDGDVLIVLSPSRQYQLHSRTLILHSDYFKRALAEDKAVVLSAKARREGATIRFRLELELANGEASGVGRFWLRPLDDRGRPQAAYTAADLEAGKSTLPIYHHYDNLFRLYYYQPARLNDTNISEVLRDVVGLADVAEHLGSMHTVSLVIDNALIKQGQVLYRSIASNATVWADLAYRVRSELIFREALIHMVGQWPKISQSSDTVHIMRPEIMAVCKIKNRELDDTKRAIELRIMGHYPQHMQRPTNNNVGPGSHTIRGTGKSTRANAYASDAFAWMALNLFRHWLGQHVCGDMNRHASDGGFNFYHAIRKAGDSYIDHQAVEGFAKYFPLSAKARNAFVTQLNILKEGVRSYVDSLVENRSMLDISKWPVRYLTCLHVKSTDMPWLIPEDAIAAQAKFVRPHHTIYPAANTTVTATNAVASAAIPRNNPNPRKRQRAPSPPSNDNSISNTDLTPLSQRTRRRLHPPSSATNNFTALPTSSSYHADADNDNDAESSPSNHNNNNDAENDADDDTEEGQGEEEEEEPPSDYDDDARDEDYQLPDVRARPYRGLGRAEEDEQDDEDGEGDVEMKMEIDVRKFVESDGEGDEGIRAPMAEMKGVGGYMDGDGYVNGEVNGSGGGGGFRGGSLSGHDGARASEENEMRLWMVERGD